MNIRTLLTRVAPTLLAITLASSAAAQRPQRPALPVDSSHGPYASSRSSVVIPDFLDRRGAHAHVLLLGVFHFDNPGRDLYKEKFIFDPMTPAHQRQIEDVAERLARFRPNKIVVESQSQPRMDSLYAAYLAGRYTPGPSEVFQLGFRIAKTLGLPRVYAVDTWSGMNQDLTQARYDSLMKAHPARDSSWQPRTRAMYEFIDSLKVAIPLAQFLTVMNDPAVRRDYLADYLTGPFTARGADDYFGPDFSTAWWNRNLRIFSNIQQITGGPNDRILVIFGAGHMPLLQHAFWASPQYTLEDVRDYLSRKR